MKRTLYSLCAVAAVLCSCNDAFLDRYPQDQMTDANFWQTEGHLAGVANTFTSSLYGKYWLKSWQTVRHGPSILHSVL